MKNYLILHDVKEFMAIDVAACYEKYGPMVIRRCRSLLRSEEEAMDAVQDVFLNLQKARERLTSSFPSSLLYTMATNVCLNRLKARKREWTIKDDDSLSYSEVFFITDSGYEEVDAKLLMEAILKNESEETRTMLFMYHADGMSLKEIGDAIGLSVSGVKKRLDVFRERARLRLREGFYE